jgi:hypothetical protein
LFLFADEKKAAKVLLMSLVEDTNVDSGRVAGPFTLQLLELLWDLVMSGVSLPCLTNMVSSVKCSASLICTHPMSPVTNGVSLPLLPLSVLIDTF